MDPAPIEPEVAAELLTVHLDDFFHHSPYVAAAPDQWCRHDTGDALSVVVGIPARSLPGKVDRDRFHLLIDATYYDTWPVRVRFVEKVEDCEWIRARNGSRAFPHIAGSPGAPAGPATPFGFALHDNYNYPDQEANQLICFSYSFDYYTSGHCPNEHQKWRPGRDRLAATLSRLFIVLNSESYLGASAQRAA